MIAKGKTRTKLFLVCAVVAATCSAQAATAQASDLSQAQARKAARTAVTQSDSYKQIKSSFALKVRACKVSGNRANCTLYRSVSQPCGLSGGPQPGQLCTNNVAHRAWSVKVTGNSGTIVSTSDVIGQFEPSSSADSARRNR